MTMTRRQFEIASMASLAAAATGRLRAAEPASGDAKAGKSATKLPKEVPWLAEVQTRPFKGIPDAPRLPPLLVDAKGLKITDVGAWLRRRLELRREWSELLGSWAPPKEPPSYDVMASDRLGEVSRQLISYETEPGVTVEAYLLTPARVFGRLPGVVVLHSTVDHTIRQGAGLEGPAEAAWGLKLAQKGMVVLCPRCFLWNSDTDVDYQKRVDEHWKRHPRSRGIAKMTFDGSRALDLLANHRQVDPKRLGVAGHSLGGKEALYLAAMDDRVKAAVSSEGGIGTAFSNWHATWYLDTKQLGREHHELLGLIAPRAFLLIGGDSADGARSWPFIEASLDVYRLFGQPARVGLYNHVKGHTIPPLAEARTYEWLQTYL